MYERHLLTYSLVKTDAQLQPIGSASGCVVEFKEHLFLLSVGHALGDGGKWHVITEYFPGKGVKMKPLDMTLMKVMTFGSRLSTRDVDFAVQLLKAPVGAKHQVINSDGVITSTEEKRIITGGIAQPVEGVSYGFWGGAYDGLDQGRFYLVECLEEGLVWTDSENDMLLFRRPTPYRSYADYKGCSGAPITDDDGRLVALVVAGDEKNTGFWGLDVRRYSSVLEVEIMQSR